MVAIGDRCGLDHRRDAARLLRRRHRVRHHQSGRHLARAACVRRQCGGWRDRKRAARFSCGWHRDRADPAVHHRRLPCRGISTGHQDCGRSRPQAIPRPCDRNRRSGDNTRNRHPLSAVGGLGRQQAGRATGARKPEPVGWRRLARRMVSGEGRPLRQWFGALRLYAGCQGVSQSSGPAGRRRLLRAHVGAVRILGLAREFPRSRHVVEWRPRRRGASSGGRIRHCQYRKSARIDRSRLACRSLWKDGGYDLRTHHLRCVLSLKPARF
jgi:hypothetical protein